LPVLTLGSQRYAVRGDAHGARLALEPLTAEGRLRLQLRQLDKGATVVKLQAMLVGEDGSAFAVTSVDAPVIVPAGKYALGTVTLSVQSASSAVPLTFVFSRTGIDAEVRWHDLKKDQELVLDPIGKLRFDLDIAPAGTLLPAGATLNVQPQLFTADGLLINSCGHGDGDAARHGAGPGALVKLCGAQQALLDSAHSGFA
jgi:hypothetical protein